jgi:hypothetical protein
MNMNTDKEMDMNRDTVMGMEIAWKWTYKWT